MLTEERVQELWLKAFDGRYVGEGAARVRFARLIEAETLQAEIRRTRNARDPGVLLLRSQMRERVRQLKEEARCSS